jgi:hypothetical protein
MSRKRPEQGAFLPDAWALGPKTTLEAFTYFQCRGAASTPPEPHEQPFLGVADIAGLLWCEIQATISQYRSQRGYANAAWSDDWGIGESVIEPSAVTADSIFESTDRLAVGQSAQALHQEKHASLRCHWFFGQFLIIGVPDGLGRNFVYEFKFSSHPRSPYTFKHAVAQANIYATLFRKRRIRVHIVGPKGYTKIIDGDVRTLDAANLIDRAWALMNGDAIFRPPESWKCAPCRYARLCPVPAGKAGPTIKEIWQIAAAAPTQPRPAD